MNLDKYEKELLEEESASQFLKTILLSVHSFNLFKETLWNINSISKMSNSHFLIF